MKLLEFIDRNSLKVFLDPRKVTHIGEVTAHPGRKHPLTSIFFLGGQSMDVIESVDVVRAKVEMELGV